MRFEKLTGFEENEKNIRENIFLDGKKMNLKSGKKFQLGDFEIISLENLRKIDLKDFEGKLKVEQIVGDVQQIICKKENQNALFQVASQFNLLEMLHPAVGPEAGIEGYENDKTQGPACAIACGAATIFRNYFIFEGGPQTKNRQINCLKNIEKFLGIELGFENGYILPSIENLKKLNQKLQKMNFEQIETLKGKLDLGIHFGTQVTISKQFQTVSQIFCSALPISYSNIENIFWERFAKIILQASYEAAFFAALKNSLKTGSNKLFLTLLGGGAFGNKESRILEGIKISLKKFENTNLEIKIISYGNRNENIDNLIENL